LLTRAVGYFHCDPDTDFTASGGDAARGGLRGLMRGLRSQLCVAPEWGADELARQSVHLLLLAYLLQLYVSKSAKPVAFKAKPKQAVTQAVKSTKAVTAGPYNNYVSAII